MSTTPRTDAARGFHDMDTAVSAEDMAQLETELAEAKASFKEERTFLIAEIKELNAEVERLKKDTSDMGTWVGSKMLQPEWDSFKQSLEVIEYWKTRAELAEASAKLWEADALRYANNTEFWKDRAEKAEAEVEQLTNHYRALQVEVAVLSEGLSEDHAIYVATNRAEKAEAELDRLREELAVANNWAEHHAARGNDLIAENINHAEAAIRSERLWKEFITLMDITEESDSGNAFNPNKISSCRAMDGKRLNEILNEARQIVFKQ